MVRLEDLNSLEPEAGGNLARGMELGCFWLWPGEHEALADTKQIFRDVNATMDRARTAKHWEENRFSTPKNKFLEALMHSVYATGTSYFERPSFETSTTIVRRAEKHAPRCYEDIAPSIKQAHELVGEVTDQVFDHMDRLLGVERFVGGNRKAQQRPITLHRVTPAERPGTKKVAAQEHFDFNLCNVLLYNYCQGFKIYHGGEWHQIAEPPRPDMLLFNLGSCLSVRTSRRISSLFHRVDTPLESQRTEPRLSLVCVFAPALTERLKTHPKLIQPEDPRFEPHTYAEHVFYAGDNYTKLNKHVIFEGNGKVREPGVRFRLKETALTAARVKLHYTFRSIWVQLVNALRVVMAPYQSRSSRVAVMRACSWWATIVVLLAGAAIVHAARS